MKNQWLEQNDVRFFKKKLMEPMAFPKVEIEKANVQKGKKVKVAFSGDLVVIGDRRILVHPNLDDATISLLKLNNVEVVV